ncbi:extracellular substrate binding-like orphan protein GrrP [Aphanothece sacrum]|uniref:ABC transporter substrate-binding protein n=1 Tax=Aphanothece sacrum FPU1 TaxID=1920663 RepID=A0A401IEV8_APHSA|nr:extracellular substrate binding-like orphan protein GrrP [Aphanothece sacrum]GBF79803.1 ABC transporter substrate-binding protein [Aphanothece sacrum FPU1]GBF84815.1 ABC transporter substrate-binding protein [Aphanothece sacrum FPU3]
MSKILSIALFSLMAGLTFPGITLAETVMERVAKTGVLTVGTRTDVVPYSYVNEKQELTGYSIDVLELIREQLQKELGKEVILDVVKYDQFGDRIQKIVNREIDISCDTIFTWERDKFVDFSLGYGVSGIKVVVKKDSGLESPESLKNKRIGIVKNTLRPRAIEVVQSQVTIVPLDSVEAGFAAVAEGKIDGFAYDGIILEGMRQTMSNANAFKVVPKESYFKHGIACMVPENDSSFLNLVNYTIVKMMDGYLAGDTRYMTIVNRYFGTDGIVPIDADRIRNFFEMIVITREQIPPQTTQSTK